MTHHDAAAHTGLWQNVLIQAIKDLSIDVSKIQDDVTKSASVKAHRDAHAFFGSEEPEDLYTVCQMADISFSVVRAAYKAGKLDRGYAERMLTHGPFSKSNRGHKGLSTKPDDKRRKSK